MASKVPAIKYISGFSLVALLFIMLFTGGWVLKLACVILSLFFTFDVITVFRGIGKKVYSIPLYIADLLLLPACLFLKAESIIYIFLLMPLIMFVFALFDKEHNFEKALHSAFVFVYPILPSVALISITCLDDKLMTTILLFISCMYPSFADMGGFYFGKYFGKQKLCPEVSPNKTIAGSIGGFVWSTVFGTLLGLFVKSSFFADIFKVTVEIDFVHFVIMGFLCGGFAQVGDLIASMVKRYGKVKDFGTYFPGQGGTLDRFDSILICAVIVFVYSRIFIL